MFTNEIEFDETVTTVLDESGTHEDVQLYIDDNEVYIRQWNELRNRHELVVMSHRMFQELLEAMKHPAGAYVIVNQKEE
jgi:hypothetical protein